ncbi:MAG: helix-turn-helix transcriptional regulator [Gemmatimonadetes bacterium]|nr:helix-turn-helix transcriptional regulator [Gemmatimonadota bacterium]
MQSLREGEATVTDPVTTTGLRQANVSKHLQQLHAHGGVARRKEGLFTWYRLSGSRGLPAL